VNDDLIYGPEEDRAETQADVAHDGIAEGVDPAATESPSVIAPAAVAPAWGVDNDADPQVRQRLLALSLRMERMEHLLEQMAQEVGLSGSQLNALTRNLADVHLMQPVDARLAELSVRLESNQEQLAQLAHILGTTAKQEQLDELTRTLKRLNRTQFKSNALGETKEERVEQALKLLQDALEGRTQVQDRTVALEQQRREDVRRDARGEFAADFLPVLDSLELALQSGRALLDQQRQSMAESEETYRAWRRSMTESRQTAETSVWRKLRRSLGAEEATDASAPEPPPLPASVQEVLDATQAWLDGLELVYRRALALLAAEGVQEIRAQGRPFDPHLHVAVETALTDDVPPNTVVDVTRKGYRQHGKVLRYAEVVVSQSKDKGHEIQNEQLG